MSIKKIIPCLDIKDGNVIKGVNFENFKIIASPVDMAIFYNTSGADELVFYDIAASYEKRGIMAELFKEVAKNVDIPLVAGGGIKDINDFGTAISYGAAKVSINSGALKDPSLIKKAAEKYGSNTVILAMDVKRTDGQFKVFADGGRINTGRIAAEWAKFAMDNGAGELVINSIDTDGVKQGFDIDLLKSICNAVTIPVVASGGAGTIDHFIELFTEIPEISAGLAATVFHSKEILISDLKKILKEKGFEVNL